MKVKKLDRRFTGHDKWKYYVDFKQTSAILDAREWFFAVRVNEHWSWINDDYKYRIYLQGRDEAALFTLKWA